MTISLGSLQLTVTVERRDPRTPPEPLSARIPTAAWEADPLTDQDLDDAAMLFADAAERYQRDTGLLMYSGFPLIVQSPCEPHRSDH